ncbi:hypothetical protein CRYUN_Cryun22dG0039900 [Craigia yunnanensis]
MTKIDRVYSPLHVEIKAILFGLEIAWNNSFISLSVESDSLVAIQEIEKHLGSLCEWESILSDIKDLSFQYERCSFHFDRSSANVFAHNMAKLRCKLGEIQV